LGGRSSGHNYTVTRKTNGTTVIDVGVLLDGKNLKGRALGFVLGIFGERVLGGALHKTIKAIEARNNGSRR
jgi:hypothetical protein